MTKTRAWSRAGLAAVVAMVLLAGCTSGGDADKTASNGDSTGSSTVEVAPLVDLTKTIGDPVEFQVPDSSGDTVTVGVLGLEVDGKIQIMHLVFTPNFTSKSKDATVTLEDLGATWAFFDPELVDRANLKIYSAVERSSTAAETTNGQPLYVYFVFAAPEDEGAVDFDLHIIDSWVPLKVKVEK